MALIKDTKENENKSNVKIQNQLRTGNVWREVENSLVDIKDTFGFTPEFVNNLVDQGLPGAWHEVKSLRFGTNTALTTKFKGLLGMAVASQIPCEMISYFDQNATKAEGATRLEQLESVQLAALTRHWSTILNGSQLDKADFRKEVDKVMSYVQKMMADSLENMPSEKQFLLKPTTAEEAYQDIEDTLGLIPTFFHVFPEVGIAGAWSEFKSLQLNPYTALSGKQKELIGIAVAAQIPCDYCIYFHRSAAAIHGATESEMQEAVSIAALTRHWSSLFHGLPLDQKVFKQEAELMIKGLTQRHLQ